MVEVIVGLHRACGARKCDTSCIKYMLMESNMEGKGYKENHKRVDSEMTSNNGQGKSTYNRRGCQRTEAYGDPLKENANLKRRPVNEWTFVLLSVLLSYE